MKIQECFLNKGFFLAWTYVINDFNGEETVGMFHEKELQETEQAAF